MSTGDTAHRRTDDVDPEARRIAAAMPRLTADQLDQIGEIVGRSRRNASEDTKAS